MLPDDELDARLRTAGERFRSATTEPARVDVRAAVDGASRHRGARLRGVLLAAAAVVVVAGVAVAVTQLSGRPGNGHSAAGTLPNTGTPTPAAVPLTGTEWRLARFVDARGNASGPVVAAGLRIDVSHGAATLDANDGCNALGGPVTIGKGTLRFGNLISTTMGCLNPDLGAQTAAIHAVIAGGTTGYTIDGNRLTLTRGTARLEYTVAARPSSTPPDPKNLQGHSWRLRSVERVTGGTASSETVSGSFVLTFDGGGHYTLAEKCGSYHGEAAVSAGTVRFDGARFVPSSPCGAAARGDQLDVQGVLSAVRTWTLDDTTAQLRLSTGDTTLVFAG